jgi:ligand-binding sensor protein
VHKVCRRARFGTHDLVNLIKPAERRYREDDDYIEVLASVSVFEMKRTKAENSPS